MPIPWVWSYWSYAPWSYAPQTELAATIPANARFIVASATIFDNTVETRTATATTAIGPEAALFSDGFEAPN